MRRQLAACAIITASACATVQRDAPAQRVRLVVLIVVDQMRTDYLDRALPHLRAGLRRLTSEGAWFHEAAYPYLNTVTCAGHSTIATGALPYRHGMVLNAWWDRETGRQRPCTSDPSVRNIAFAGQPAGGDSARSLLTTTLAERLASATGGRVVSLSFKPRAAIPTAGRSATAVVWYDDAGGWTTSTAFTNDRIEWVDRYIAGNPITGDAGKVWALTLPVSSYRGTDDGPGERFPAGWTRTFPHALSESAAAAFVSQWLRTPFADEYLERMAVAAIEALGLGRGTGTDFLAVSFSSLDSVGHQFGPDSFEVQDTVLRLDGTIGALLDALDAAVGRGRYVAALSSDHGVGPLPEQSGGGRQTGDRALDAINQALAPFLGPGKHAIHAAYTDLYLAPGVPDRLKADPAATAAVVEALEALPAVAKAFPAEDIRSPEARKDPDPVRRAVALSYHGPRSGDFIIVPKRNWLLSGTAASSHGTLYEYDQRVPVIFYGPGVRAGRRTAPATPADIAPTIAALVRVSFAAPDGRALVVGTPRR